MESLGRYAAPLFMGASLLYALGQKHRRDVTKERQEGAHNRCVDGEKGREGWKGYLAEDSGPSGACP